MSHTPAISVILPTRDRPDLLRVALKSLAWQTFRDFEVIVVNDGETDVVPAVKEFARGMDVRIAAHGTPREGPSAARNTGIRLSRGNWLVYLDDDDFFYKEHLETLHGAVAPASRKVAYTDAFLAVQERIGGEFRTVGRSLPLSLDFDAETLTRNNITPIHTLIHEKRCLERCLPFAPYLHAHEDWDLWQRMGRHYPFTHLARPTAEFLRREGASSLSAVKEVMAETWIFVRRQGLLHNALPPVYVLEEAAAAAIFAGPAAGPCRVSVVLPIGRASAFAANIHAMRALTALCGSLGDAQLILAGAGEHTAEICRHAAARLARPPRFVQTILDVGRVFSANLGASLAEGDWLAFLEPGVEPRAGWLDALLAAAEERPNAGVLGGSVEAPRIGRFAGGRFNNKGELIFNRLSGRPTDESLLEAECLPGHCLMLRREHFLSLGGFHPAFAPGHYADADLCLRLKRRGMDCLAVPKARLLWNQSGSPLRQCPAGLVSRRTFHDAWATAPFALASLASGAEWSMRPEDQIGLYSSDGHMPPTFDVILPPSLR